MFFPIQLLKMLISFFFLSLSIVFFDGKLLQIKNLIDQIDRRFSFDDSCLLILLLSFFSFSRSFFFFLFYLLSLSYYISDAVADSFRRFNHFTTLFRLFFFLFIIIHS